MALLNYALTYNEILPYLLSENPSENDKLKIFISADGHFITHGVDILKDFNGIRGIVPSYTGSEATKGVLVGSGEWKQIFDILPVDNSRTLTKLISDEGNNSKNFIPSVYQVNEFVNNAIATTEVMRFKGIMTVDSGKILGNGTEITSCEIGDTYRFEITSGYGQVAGYHCERGDLVICIKDGTGTGTSLNTNEYWRVVQTNIDGTTTNKINGKEQTVYTSVANQNAYTIWAPTSNGTNGFILIAQGGNNTPIWQNPDSINVSGALKLVSTLTDTTGVSKGGTTTPVYFENGVPKACTLPSINSYSLIATTANNSITQNNTTNPFINLISTSAGSSTVASSLLYIGSGHLTIQNNGSQITFSSTWRDVQIPNNTTAAWESIGNKTLRFSSSDDLYLIKSEDSDNILLSFGILWYNISTNKIETPTL